MVRKKLAWISIAVSIIALVSSIIALANCCPTQGLRFDYIGVIIGILALLVTALIGAQVGQYVFVDRKIESISKPITRIIARKVAAEVAHHEASKKAECIAREVAETKAMEVVGGLPRDIAYVLRGKDLMNKSTPLIMISNYMIAIDYVINALKEFKQCGSATLYQSTVDDALEIMNNYFELSNKHGGIRVLKGQKEAYAEVLKDLHSELLPLCLDYLSQAEEMGKEEDDKIREETV